MLKLLSLLPGIFLATFLSAQVAVNTSGTPPHASAMLDVSSTNKGLLVPNVSLTDVTTVTPIGSPATGLLVWNTNASVTGGSGVGFYFWDGSKWQSLLSDNTGWRLRGNSNTIPSIHFVGTTDNNPIFFKVDNKDVGRIDPSYANLFLGAGAGFSWSTTNSRRNTLVGDSAGFSNATGSDNSFFGSKAGIRHTSG